jgi:hypothetical protein
MSITKKPQGMAKPSANSSLKGAPAKPAAKPAPAPAKSSLTRVIVKCDVGFGNTLFIRGKGANLNWNKGISLKNIKADEWIWECNQPFSECEFKVLINDVQYEMGENHRVKQGSSVQLTPRFS